MSTSAPDALNAISGVVPPQRRRSQLLPTVCVVAGGELQPRKYDEGQDTGPDNFGLAVLETCYSPIRYSQVPERK